MRVGKSDNVTLRILYLNGGTFWANIPSGFPELIVQYTMAVLFRGSNNQLKKLFFGMETKSGNKWEPKKGP